MNRNSIWRKYGYVWITLILFFGSVIGHWTFGWSHYKQDQEAHNQPVVVSDYVNEMFKDTFENWQSEFLQLIWQVAGLAFLWHVGSPQSKEGDDRKEEKIDLIMETVMGPDKATKEIKRLEGKYPKK